MKKKVFFDLCVLKGKLKIDLKLDLFLFCDEILFVFGRLDEKVVYFLIFLFWMFLFFEIKNGNKVVFFL